MCVLCCTIPAMGSQIFIRLTSQLTLLFLCVLFVNNVSVILGVPAPTRRADLQDYPDPADVADEESALDDFAEQTIEYEEKELENIKQTVIQGLGLKRVPDVTKMNVSQEEYSRMYGVYLKRLEDKQSGLSDDDTPIPVFYTFHQKERHTRRKRRRGVWHMSFDLSTLQVDSIVEHANLRLLVPGLSRENAELYGSTVRVQVYQVPSGHNRHQQRTRTLVEERDIHISTQHPKWTELDVSEAVRTWMTGPGGNLSLEVQCKDCIRRRISLTDDASDPVLNVLLTTYPDDGERSKRSAEQALYYVKNRRTDCHKNSKRCCRHRMDFDLRQLGLEFIIQPKTFDGGICKGRCPPRYNSAHNHAVLQSLMWKKNKTLTPRVCCAPSKLRALEILSVDEDDSAKLTVKHWDDMVVMECACS